MNRGDGLSSSAGAGLPPWSGGVGGGLDNGDSLICEEMIQQTQDIELVLLHCIMYIRFITLIVTYILTYILFI